MVYDVFYLVGGQWQPFEQIEAPSRRKAMYALRSSDQRCTHTDLVVYDGDKRIVKHGGPLHGRVKVRLSATNPNPPQGRKREHGC